MNNRIPDFILSLIVDFWNVALAATCQIARDYDIDEWGMKVAAIQEAAKAASSASQNADLASRAWQIITEAIAIDRFDIAKTLGEVSLACSRKAKDANLINLSIRRNKEIARIQKDYQEVQESNGTVASVSWVMTCR